MNMKDPPSEQHQQQLQSQQQPPDGDATRLVECGVCGHSVPAMNFALHNATCHREIGEPHDSPPAPAATETAPLLSPNRSLLDLDEEQEVVPTNQAHQSSTGSPVLGHNQAEAAAAAGIPAVSSGTTSTNPATNNNHDESSSGEEGYWSCPQCTLLNPQSVFVCQACDYMNQSLFLQQQQQQQPREQQQQHQRQQTTTQQQPQISVNVQEYDAQPFQTAGNILCYATLGGLLGGGPGCLAGAATGAIVDGYQRWRNGRDRHNENQNQDSPDQTATNTTTTTSPTRPSSTFTVATITGPNHLSRTIVFGGGGGAANRGGVPHPAFPGLASPQASSTLRAQEIDRIIHNMLIQSVMMQQGGMLVMPGGRRVQDMDYDELLERYGFGNEHRRGATQQQIDALPLTRIPDGADAGAGETTRAGGSAKTSTTSTTTSSSTSTSTVTCNICLEDSQKGDQMRQLPCQHAFHRECIDRWLRTVASCPICKRDITTSATNTAAQHV